MSERFEPPDNTTAEIYKKVVLLLGIAEKHERDIHGDFTDAGLKRLFVEIEVRIRTLETAHMKIYTIFSTLWVLTMAAWAVYSKWH